MDSVWRDIERRTGKRAESTAQGLLIELSKRTNGVYLATLSVVDKSRGSDDERDDRGDTGGE